MSTAGIKDWQNSPGGGTPLSEAALDDLERRTWSGYSILAYGAVGDGAADDTDAIDAAIADLVDGVIDHLLWPAGCRTRYTTVNPAAGGAIVLPPGLSGKSLIFGGGAELVMDNLQGDGTGGGPGIVALGEGDDILIYRPVVRWTDVPSSRSNGDGIRCVGWNGEDLDPGVTEWSTGEVWDYTTGTITGLRIFEPRVINAPQSGVIVMGCDNPQVWSANPERTLADGMHFNACRRPVHHGVVNGVETGDDTCALVTYQDDTDRALGSTGPFASADLDEWCNGGAHIGGVAASGGSANGCRLAMVGPGFYVGPVTANGKTQGLIIDSGQAGGSFGWSHLACGVGTVEHAEAVECGIGVLLRTFNVDEDDDPKWWRANVRIKSWGAYGCTNRPFRLEGIATVKGVCAGYKIGPGQAFGNTGAVSISGLRHGSVGTIETDGDIQIFGVPAVWTAAMAGMPVTDVVYGDLFSDTGIVALQDINGATFAGKIRSSNSPTDGLTMTRVLACGRIAADVRYPNRVNTGTVRGLLLTKVQDTDVDLDLTYDANAGGTFRSWELGGGDATDVTKNVHLGVKYRNTLNTAGNGATIQGGGNGPTNCYIEAEFYNGGEGTPVWRTEKTGIGCKVVRHFVRAGTPEANVTAPVGSTCTRSDGGASTTFYVKESGTGNTGWVAK